MVALGGGLWVVAIVLFVCVYAIAIAAQWLFS
jgi:hypothetical protein